MLERSIQERARLGQSIHDEERLQVLNNALRRARFSMHATFVNYRSTRRQVLPVICHSLIYCLIGLAITKYERLNCLLSELEDKYGQYLDVKSPFWTFNQSLRM